MRYHLTAWKMIVHTCESDLNSEMILCTECILAHFTSILLQYDRVGPHSNVGLS